VLLKQSLVGPDVIVSGGITTVSEEVSNGGNSTKPEKTTSKPKTATMDAFLKRVAVAGSSNVGDSAGMTGLHAGLLLRQAPLTFATADNVTATHPSGERVRAVVLDSQHPSYTGEGRLITVEMGTFVLVAAYVPNSGQGLVRLDYRVDGWDPYIREYLSHLRDSHSSIVDGSIPASRGVIYCGDMNVGHLDQDIYNHTAKHITKQAGLTPRERASFTKLLDAGFKDAFRYFHPGAY
jgi:hypothetical protein